jgi:hypothetical protein
LATPKFIGFISQLRLQKIGKRLRIDRRIEELKEEIISRQ